MTLEQITMTLVKDKSRESAKASKFLENRKGTFAKNNIRFREIHSSDQNGPCLIISNNSYPIKGYEEISSYIKRKYD